MEQKHEHIDPFSPEFLENDRDPSTPYTAYVGIVGTLLLAAIIWWLTAVYHTSLKAENYLKQIVPKPLEREEYRAEQETLLHGYGWVSEANGVARIPIDRAMDLVVQERAAHPVEERAAHGR